MLTLNVWSGGGGGQEGGAAARSPKRLLPLSMLALALALAGCGGDDDSRSPPTQTTSDPLGRAPSAPAPPGAPSTTAPSPPDEGEVPGGEQDARVPATLILRGGRFSPRTVSVPPFLAVALSVAATDGRAHTVVVATDPPRRLRVPAGRRTTILVPGQPAGRYAITSGAARAFLVVGGEPGP